MKSTFTFTRDQGEMPMNGISTLDQRLPPMGTTFFNCEDALDDEARLKRANRFKSSPPCLNTEVRQETKGKLPEAKPMSPSTLNFTSIWGNCSEPTSPRSTTEEGSTSGSTTECSTSSQQDESLSLAEQTQQAVLARRRRRTQAEATDQKTPAALPVLLNHPGPELPEFNNEVYTAVTDPPRSAARPSEEALSLAQRSRQSFLASKKLRDSRRMTSSPTGPGSPGYEAALPTLLDHRNSNPVTQTKAQAALHEQSLERARETREAVMARLQRRAERLTKESSVSSETTGALPVLLGRSEACEGTHVKKAGHVEKLTRGIQVLFRVFMKMLVSYFFEVGAVGKRI